jgi:hypothetical protein
MISDRLDLDLSVGVGQIVIDQDVRCARIFPVEDRTNTSCPANHSKNWEGATVSLRLKKREAIKLARVILAATQEWDHINITGWRYDRRRSDGTYRVTVTSQVEPEPPLNTELNW